MDSDLEASMRSLAEALRGRASAEAERRVGAPLNRRIDDSLDLLDHNEAVVGFENLVSNIHEYEVAITTEEYEVIRRLATTWGIAPERWAYVSEMRR